VPGAGLRTGRAPHQAELPADWELMAAHQRPAPIPPLAYDKPVITPPCDVTDVEILGHYRLRLTFSDGLAGDAGLPGLRDWGGVFTPSATPVPSRAYERTPRPGRSPWPDGADLAPEVLHERASAHPRQASRRLAAG